MTPRLHRRTQSEPASPKRKDDSLSPGVSNEKSKTSKKRKALLSYTELPEWHQDNEYILHGYRQISGSARISFLSWSYLHNESVNIYSHLIPSITFLLGEWYTYEYLTRRYSNITATDLFIFSFFLLAAAICLGLSAMYHTLMNHSHKVEQLWLQLDLIGIVILILGDFVSGIHMIFWCEPHQRKIYWSMIGALGLVTILITIKPRSQGSTSISRTFRTLTFVATGLSGFAPLIHGVKMFGFAQMMKQSGMPYYLIERGFHLIGAFIFVVSKTLTSFLAKEKQLWD